MSRKYRISPTSRSAAAGTVLAEQVDSTYAEALPMSLPREIVPGTTYLITRRCTQRQFWLRPDGKVSAILRFCLVHAARLFGIVVHGFIFLSNHYHLAITDIYGRLPEFMRWLNEFSARALNQRHRRKEALWKAGSYHAERLEGSDEILRALVYIGANPAAAGLVKRGYQWPGVRSGAYAYGQTICAKRPEGFFREDGTVPEEATCELTRPPGFEDMTDEALTALLAEQVARRENEFERAREAEGRSVLGPKRILAQDPSSCPENEDDAKRASRLDESESQRRKRESERYHAFYAAYETARRLFKRGIEVLFPSGTYWLRIHAGVACMPGG